MSVTRSQLLTLLEPGLSEIWNEAYPRHAAEYVRFVNLMDAKKATITTTRMTNFGTLRLKGEGEAITQDEPIFGGTKTFQPVRFALKYGVSQETQDHELYGQVDTLEQGLMTSAIDQQEVLAANILNGAFATTASDGYSATGFDGLALCSTSHTRLDGGAVIANRPGTDADLGVGSLQNGIIAFENIKDERGRPSRILPKLLIISPEDVFTAEELLSSEYKPGTANNDVNAVRKYGLTYMVSHYKTDTDAWFLFGDKTGVKFIWDVRPRTEMWEDKDKEVIFRKCVQGMFVGHDSWRGVYGTSGAG
jgi:hypothetical protein